MAMAMASSSLFCFSFPPTSAASISSLRPAVSASEANHVWDLKPNASRNCSACIGNVHQTSQSTLEEHRSKLATAVGIIYRMGAIALSAGIFLSGDPALAFKGGGPYGTEVTRGQDLSGKDFSGRILVKQDFKTSILRQANFKGAKLLGASFFDSDLTGADLSDADLRGADFSLANAAKANFSNANLEGALVTGNTSFKGARIEGADFTDVFWRNDQREYLCKIADGVNPITGNVTKDTLLCS